MGRMAPRYISAGLFVLTVVKLVCAFNIDTNIPIIKRGQQNSYFGFSIAQHQVTNSADATEENLLLVGAPRLDNKASVVSKTGGLFKCNAQSAEEKCIFLSTIDRNISSEGQWLGSTVRSKGRDGLSLVCAFRFSVNYNPIGRCILLDKTLQFREEIPQCKDDSREHEGTAYCQSGASAQVLPDEELLIGAPGAHDWTGRVSKIYKGPELGIDTAWHHSPSSHAVSEGTSLPPVDKNSLMGFSVVAGKFKGYSYKRMYVGGAPKANTTGQVVLFFSARGKLDYYDNQIIDGEKPFSAFGYDVTAIDFDNDGFDELVVGSPMYVEYKDRYVGGAVYVYSDDTQLNAFSNYVKLVQPMSEEECMEVLCLDARFGHTVSPAGDVNLDGYPDLVIGAPYDNRGKGAVYIYHGSKNGIVEKYSQKITPSDLPQSVSTLNTFGHSLTGGLDLDSNGYPDIAVGAYANDSVVMLRTRPIVHLMSTITVDPPQFNLNTLPGCPFDDKRLVIVPKYCVQLQICLNFSAKPYESFSTSQTIRVLVMAEKERVNKRVYFKGLQGQGDKVDSVVYNQTLEPRTPQVCRRVTVYMEDGVKDQLTPVSFHVNYSLEMQPFPSSGRKRRQASIPDINKYPVLMTDGSVGGSGTVTTVMAKVDFVKKCGTDDLCQSRLNFDMKPSLDMSDDGEYLLNFGVDKEFDVIVKLTNMGEPAYEPTLYLTGGSDLKFLSSSYINPNEFGSPCDGVGRDVKCELPNPFGDPDRVEKIEIKLRFGTSKLDPSIPRFNITAIFNTTSIEQTPEDDEAVFFINIVTRADVQVFGQSSPSGDVIYQGRIRGESAITEEDQIGPAVNHTFTIYNQGPGTIDRSQLFISVPYEKQSTEFSEGKRILYLLQVAVVEPRDERKAFCEHNPVILNPLGYKVNPDFIIRETNVDQEAGPKYTIVTGRRKKREVEQQGQTTQEPGNIKPQEKESRERKNNVVTLDCDKGKAKCHTIKCSIGRLDERNIVRIVVRSRLWESTLLRDYPDADEVQITSKARIVLPKELNVKQEDVSDDIGYATTYAVPYREVTAKQEIPWWIILVAVLSGIIVLIVLIVILWKCNFFKRLKPDGGYEPTFSGEIKKKDYDMNDFN